MVKRAWGAGHEYVYTALQLAGMFGGSLFCLYSIAFRWSAVTHKYGRIDLYFWVICIQFIFVALSLLSICALWGIEVAIWYVQNRLLTS